MAIPAYGETGYTNEVPRPITQDKGGSLFGFNFGDLTKMLGSKPVKSWLSSPANQRMIADFGRALSMRNGKEGTGSLMAGAASNMINREEVGKAAAAQAERRQLYNQQLMEVYKQMMAGQRTAAKLPGQGQAPRMWGDSQLGYETSGTHPLIGGA